MSNYTTLLGPAVLLVFAQSASVLGCQASEDDGGFDFTAIPTDHIDPALLCDAGDEAFVRDAVATMWGRFPVSIREVEVLVQVVEQTGRANLIRRMARSPEYRARWGSFLKDALGVARIGMPAKPACTGDPLMTGPVDGALASHVRDTAPGGAAFPTEWNLADLVQSALALDDISPVYRAALFTHQASALLPPKEGDGNLIGEEAALRKRRSAAFQRSYLHRSLVCIGCHNALTATTDSPDPKLDRHWPLDGFVELALFGDHTGRPAPDLEAFFRTGGVVSVDTVEQDGLPMYVMGDGIAPWGVSFDCGRYLDPSTLEPDPFEMSGWFIAPHPTASVWDLEAHLQAGFEGLRKDGLNIADDQTVSGDEAFAQLVTLNIADQVWAELTGNRLTVVNSFPRNRLQRDVLKELTAAFVGGGFSLVELLVAVMTHPLYNQAAPVACEGPASAYHLPPVFDPWTVDYDDTTVRGNSVGDTIRRRPPRVLLRAVTSAMGWEMPQEYFIGVDQGFKLPEGGELQRDIGVFLKDSEMGFRGTDLRGSLAWEDAYGGCALPPAATGDFITELLSSSQAEHTLEDALSALKDRLMTDPDVTDPTERQLLEALAGAPLTTKLLGDADAEARLRKVCGAWLQSPQVLLTGISPAPRLGSTVAIVVEGTSAAALCATVAALFEDGEATCDGATLTVAKD